MGLFKKVKEKSLEDNEEEYLICPHCEGRLDEDNQPENIYGWRTIDGALIGCPHCKKVLGVETPY